MLTLHYAPGACSIAAHIVLEEIGAPFEAQPVALRKGQQYEPAYLAINPRGKVPALVTTSGVVTENVALLAYLADLAPEKQLLPRDAFARAQALSWLGFLTSDMHASFGPLFVPQRFIDAEAAHADLQEKARARVAANLADVNARLAGREWAVGEFSVVDAYLYPFFHWASAYMGFDMSPYANYSAHHARMKARPAVQRALAREEAAKAMLEAA